VPAPERNNDSVAKVDDVSIAGGWPLRDVLVIVQLIALVI
jgi:hypothetical protein